MGKRFTYILVLVLIGFSSSASWAQDFKRAYKNALEFFKEGNYNLAMEAIKPCLVYDKDNPYEEYASFYYAQAALRQNYRAVAKNMFLQIKKLYPEWDQINEVNYWLAKIYFDQGEYFQAMHMLSLVKQEDAIEVEEIVKIKANYLIRITDSEILRMMWENYPQDVEVGKALARCIGRQPLVQQDKQLLDSVINTFHLDREQFVKNSTPLPVFKDAYNVSLLFPFLTATLDPSPNEKRNQLILDLYEGMRLANDTLRKQGIHVNLLGYDTQRNPDVLKLLLERDELKHTDLIVGPLFPEETPMVQEFSETHQINMINPVSNNSEYTGLNPFAMLFQPSFETIAIRSAELLAMRTRNKNCMIFYGDAPKDSVMAASFAHRATEAGLNVVWSEEFRRETASRIISILASPTEYDERKNPIQFTLKLDSIGSIFVASNNALIYTKVISSVDSRGDSLVIIGAESWLDNPSVDLNKYEKLHVMFSAPNFTSLSQPSFIEFRKRYIRTHGSFPAEYMNYSKLGFEFMMCIGNALKKHGVYFQEGLAKEGMLPGWLSKGYQLSPTRDNHHVRFAYFRQGELVAVD